MIVLSHSAAEGTVARGDTRPHKDALKALGMRWYAAGGFWYVPRTRGLALPDRDLAAVAESLRRAGAEVSASVAPPPAPGEPVEVPEPAEIAAARAERLRERAAAASAEAQHQYERSRQAVAGIPFGQPILVGHHSERRHRRDVERSHVAMGRSVEAAREAESLERRAEAAEALAERMAPGALEATVSDQQAIEAVAALVGKHLKRDVGAENVRRDRSAYAIGFFVRYPDAMGVRPWSVHLSRRGGDPSVEAHPYMEPAGAQRASIAGVAPEEVYRAILRSMPRSPEALAREAREAGAGGRPRAVKPARARAEASLEADAAFDAGLRVGQPVEARWTSSGRRYRGQAVVASVAEKSVRAQLSADVPSQGAGTYRAGQVLVLPRLLGGRTAGNGVFPLVGEASVPNQSGGRRATSPAGREARAAVEDYARRYLWARGNYPRLVVGMSRGIAGWPVRDASGGNDIGYFATLEEAEGALRHVARATGHTQSGLPRTRAAAAAGGSSW